MPKQRAIFILQGRAKLFQPTSSHPTWRVVWNDPITGRRMQTSGGRTRETAEATAAERLGDWVDRPEASALAVPTVQEAWDSWKTEHGFKLSSRTIGQYDALARKFLDIVGTLPVTAVTPRMLASVDLKGMARDRQLSVRRIVGYAFGMVDKWTTRDINTYMNAIRITGRGGSTRQRPVSRGDIPSPKFVTACINTAYSTCQISPLDTEGTIINPITGDKKYKIRKIEIPAPAIREPDSMTFISGMPDDRLQGLARRNIPPQYQNRLERQQKQTERIAQMYRNVGLSIALGAGGGLRLGEVLGLRVRHILSKEQALLAYFAQHRDDTGHIRGAYNMYQPKTRQLAWTGEIRIVEQIGMGEHSQKWITRPKMGRTRTVHLPAFLPKWTNLTADLRTQIASYVPRFNDTAVSLWEATDDEAERLWREGFVPLGYLLWHRLDELWASVLHPEGKQGLHKDRTPGDVLEDFMNLLIVPTPTKPSKRRTIHIEDGWPYDESIVPGHGGHFQPANYLRVYLNPLLDYVSESLQEYPEHRVNARTRKGWSFHGFRHYAVSTRIIAGVPLVVIAREMGHANPAFTLQRYGHMLPEGIPDVGFEY